MDFWQHLAVAFALVLVIEGVLPFLMPGRWRDTVRQVAELDDQVLRGIGLLSMLLGIGLLYLVN